MVTSWVVIGGSTKGDLSKNKTLINREFKSSLTEVSIVSKMM